MCPIRFFINFVGFFGEYDLIQYNARKHFRERIRTGTNNLLLCCTYKATNIILSTDYKQTYLHKNKILRE